jgi:hypothetical protein
VTSAESFKTDYKEIIEQYQQGNQPIKISEQLGVDLENVLEVIGRLNSNLRKEQARAGK